MNNIESKWYKKPLGIIVAILFFPVFLTYYAWVESQWSKNLKISVSIISISIIAVAAFNSINEKNIRDSSKKVDNVRVQEEPVNYNGKSSEDVNEEKSTELPVNFIDIQNYSIMIETKDAGYGENTKVLLVLINPIEGSMNLKSDLILLVQKMNAQYGKNIIVDIFDNEEALTRHNIAEYDSDAIFQIPVDQLEQWSKETAEIVTPHYIASYTGDIENKYLDELKNRLDIYPNLRSEDKNYGFSTSVDLEF